MVIVEPEWLGSSPAVRGLISRVERWAPLRYPILFRGERGTGKSTLARMVHTWSGRSGALVTAAMNHISDGRDIADITGSIKGAYTSSIADQASPFVRAHRGTVFLEELAWASRRSQSALLTILDTGRFTPMAGQHEIGVDARVVAATNADLEGRIASGEFLQDLFDRFGYYILFVPPLRERRDEIVPLVRRCMEHEAPHCRRQPPVLSAELIRVLERAPWPGNLRQAVAVGCWLMGNAGPQADVADLPEAFRADSGLPGPSVAPLAERARWALGECGGNKTAAARRLGISRQHLHRVLAREDGQDRAQG